MNVQLVCDDTKRIIDFVTGWPGPVHDSRCFEDSSISKYPERHFSNSQFIIADAGYTCSSWLVAPYIQPASSIPENEIFNQLFSTARVNIEHVNGILKSRFNSLKGIRVQVKTDKDFLAVNKWIIVCLILHNMLISFNDSWTEEDSDSESDDDDDDPPAQPFDPQTALEAHDLRVIVKNRLLNWFFAKQG